MIKMLQVNLKQIIIKEPTKVSQKSSLQVGLLLFQQLVGETKVMTILRTRQYSGMCSNRSSTVE